MRSEIKTKAIARSRIVPVAVSSGDGGFRYFIHGKEVQLHQFKKYCKRMPPIEVVTPKKVNDESKNIKTKRSKGAVGIR